MHQDGWDWSDGVVGWFFLFLWIASIIFSRYCFKSSKFEDVFGWGVFASGHLVLGSLMFFDGFDFAEEGVFAFFATAIFGSMILGVGSYLLMRWFYYSTAAPGAGRGSSVNAAEDVSKEKRVAYTCSKSGWYQ